MATTVSLYFYTFHVYFNKLYILINAKVEVLYRISTPAAFRKGAAVYDLSLRRLL